MTHVLTLQDITPVTDRAYRLRFVKPEGFTFTPGQATELALDTPGWRDEARPFTFTSQPEDPYLEFTIKSYPSHDGVTAEIPKLQPGDRVRIGDPWGAIHDEGPGVWIAGGAGLTPFIPILRRRAAEKPASDMTLILADATWDDLILRDDWLAMEGLQTVFVLSEEPHEGAIEGQIDRALLERHGVTADSRVYLCGPPGMEEAIEADLRDIGVPSDRIIKEAA